MTDDMKKNIINYVTNNVIQTASQERTTFLESDTLSGDLWTGDILPANYTEFKYNGIIAPNEATSNLSILYGEYYDNVANSYKGIITLLGGNFNPIKSIFQYDSGTYLRPILDLEQADDNTFYGIDNDMASTPTDRFIMLNNFTIPNSLGDYKIDLRKSYNFASNYYLDKCYKIYKSPYSAHYVMFGSSVSTMKVIDLIVNVGESNEWSIKTFNSSSGTYYQNGTPIALFDENENVFWRFLVRDYGTSSSSIKSISKDYNTSTTTTTILTSETSPTIIENLSDYCFKSSDIVFFGTLVRTGTSPNYTYYLLLYKYDFSDDTLTQIQSLDGRNDNNTIKINICNSEVYVGSAFYDNTTKFGVTRLKNNAFTNWYYTETATGYLEWFFVKANYNLISIVGLIGDEIQTIDIPEGGFLLKDNYNSLNYNGLQYTDYNSMIPKQGELYSDNSLVFARNLSDSTTNGNTTTSTMVVPSGYLNGIDLSPQKLLSGTNSSIINNTEVITKNIYETGYFNFVNTINVIDNNFGNSSVVPNGGAYVNKNINTGTEANCLDSFIGKIVITFENGYTFTNPLTWTKIDDTTAMTEFAIDSTGQRIAQIEYKSNDLTTTYLSENINLDPDVYKFTQYLKIE